MDAARAFSPTGDGIGFIAQSRKAVSEILEGRDKRLLAIVGPCSIHDTAEALDYAKKLHALAEEVKTQLFVIIRAYFEKPRSILGWKGLILDPRLDGSAMLGEGLHKAREFLSKLAEMGLPAGTEFLDPLLAPYLSDLVSWGAIGARTASSQPHREQVSGLPMPVGFKNPVDGEIKTAIDAILASSQPHVYPGLGANGHIHVIETCGNHNSHLILRGGRSGPNYKSADIEKATASMEKAGIRPAIIIDASHDNSGKQPERQSVVLAAVLDQLSLGLKGSRAIRGFMLESYIKEGRQDLCAGKPPQAGLSITDGCIGWDETRRLLLDAAGRLETLKL